VAERGEFSGEVDELLDWMEEHGQLDLEEQLEAAIEAELGAQAPVVDVPRIIRKEPL